MEAPQENNQEHVETGLEASQETPGPTAKEIAAAEEATQSAAVAAAKAMNDAAENAPGSDPMSLLSVAASGRDKLAAAFAAHNKKTAENRKVYVPPAMTERQLSNREEELEAGRKAVARAEAQKASRPVPKVDLKEGFTTPVYRPDNVVPDPMLMTNGSTPMSVAGTGKYDPDK